MLLGSGTSAAGLDLSSFKSSIKLSSPRKEEVIEPEAAPVPPVAAATAAQFVAAETFVTAMTAALVADVPEAPASVSINPFTPGSVLASAPSSSSACAAASASSSHAAAAAAASSSGENPFAPEGAFSSLPASKEASSTGSLLFGSSTNNSSAFGGGSLSCRYCAPKICECHRL